MPTSKDKDYKPQIVICDDKGLKKKQVAHTVVHELVHLIEASHNSRFKALMDQFYPDWRLCRKELHSLVISS